MEPTNLIKDINGVVAATPEFEITITDKKNGQVVYRNDATAAIVAVSEKAEFNITEGSVADQHQIFLVGHPVIWTHLENVITKQIEKAYLTEPAKSIVSEFVDKCDRMKNHC